MRACQPTETNIPQKKKKKKKIASIVFRAKRDFDVKKAEYDTEVNTARAEAELAYDLQVNIFLRKFNYLKI